MLNYHGLRSEQTGVQTDRKCNPLKYLAFPRAVGWPGLQSENSYTVFGIFPDSCTALPVPPCDARPRGDSRQDLCRGTPCRRVVQITLLNVGEAWRLRYVNCGKASPFPEVSTFSARGAMSQVQLCRLTGGKALPFPEVSTFSARGECPRCGSAA